MEQVYTCREINATDNGQAAPDLEGEQRRWARGILRGLNALQIEDSIARAERREPDAAGRTWRIGAHVGKMCRQLVYWEDKSEDPDYRVHKTAREWFESEAGLTRRQLRTATRIAIEEGLFTVEPGYRSDRRQTNYYRLNMWNLSRTVITSDLRNIERLLEREGRKYRRDTLNRKRRTLETALKDLSLLENGDSENPQLEVYGGQIDQGRWSISQPTPVKLHPLQENTQENTPKDFPPGGAAAPRARESKEEGKVPQPPKTSTLPANGENQQPAAKRLVSKLVSDLEAQDAFLDEEQRGKYGINFKALITKGVDAGELEEIRRRIVSEWSRIELSPQMALSDLRGGRGDTKTQVTLPEGVEAIRNYESTRYAPGDSVGPSIAADRENLAKVAERWDFTSDEEPPMKIRLQISDYPQECNEMISRLRRIARRGVRKVGMEKMGAFNDPVSSVTPTELVSPALEEAPEGSSTPEGAEGDSTTGAVERLLSDPESKAARLARAVVAGKSSPQGPITTEDVSAALLDEVDLEALGWPASLGREREMSTRMMAAILIRRLRDQADEE